MAIGPNEPQAVPGFKAQMVGGGLEWSPDWDFFSIALRAGGFVDLEDERERDGLDPVITGGIGLRIGVVVLDLAANVSFQQDEFRDYDVPTQFGGALSVGFTW